MGIAFPVIPNESRRIYSFTLKTQMAHDNVYTCAVNQLHDDNIIIYYSTCHIIL